MKSFIYRLLDLVERLLPRKFRKDRKKDKDNQPPDTNYPLW